MVLEKTPASSLHSKDIKPVNLKEINPEYSLEVLISNTLATWWEELTHWTSLQSKGLSGVFSNTTVQKHQFFDAQLSLWSNFHIHTWLLKKHILTKWTFVGTVTSLLFKILSRLVITFLPGSKHLLISWLQSPSAVILESKKIKSVTVSTSICHKVTGQDAWS